MTGDEAQALKRVYELKAERDTLRERVDSLLGERDNLRERTVSAEAEMQLLREQVKALEAALDRQVAMSGTVALEKRALESRLAAIRQRAGEREKLASMVRQNDVGTAVAYLIGDDAPEPEGLKPCGETPMPPEPSTAEAFATVRTYLRGADHPERLDAWAALALLEHRLGAQVPLAEALRNGGVYLSTIRDALTRGRDKDATRGDFVSALAALEAYEKPVTQWLLVLTDAPPLFTLEEIDAACAAVEARFGSEVEKLVLQELRQRLLTLRK